MKRFGVLAIAALLAGCTGQATLPHSAVSQALSSLNLVSPHAKQQVYWTLYADSTHPQVQFASAPLKKSSKAKSIPGNTYNALANTSGMRIDRFGRLWVLTADAAISATNVLDVFDLPLTPKSMPKYQFILSDAQQPKYLAIDSSGNVWVNSIDHVVLEYAGPFKKSGTLRAKLRLTKGVGIPDGMAFDRRGNLYVAVNSSYGKSSVAIFSKPIKNGKPKYLDGLYNPTGLIFDKKGNLYATDDSTLAAKAVARYDTNDLKPGDKPSVVNDHAFPGAFSPVDFAFSGNGDLYLTNCSSYAGIIVLPTGSKPFTNTLSPSVIYTNSDTLTVGCTWGIAIK